MASMDRDILALVPGLSQWQCVRIMMRISAEARSSRTECLSRLFMLIHTSYDQSARGIGVNFHGESEYFIYNFAAHLKFQTLSISSQKLMPATF